MNHEHEWIVFSTAISTGELMLYCKCGAFGVVKDPTSREWGKAFHAPSNPYKWQGRQTRVTLIEGMTTAIHPNYGVRTAVRG